MKQLKKATALSLAAIMLLTGCGAPAEKDEANAGNANSAGGDKPATWIADRTIKGRVFMDSAGGALPDDQINNEIAQKIKELTGITLEWEYTTSSDDMQTMVTSFATGDEFDVMACYLDNSGRPEFPVLLKAAKEGLFTDVVPYLKDTKVYSKYLDPEYMPYDAYKNVLMRDEFGGKGYFLQLEISREPDSVRPDGRYMYMNESIAEQLGIDPAKITSTEEMYAAAQKIKDAGIKDANGNAIIPIGPTYWGGRRQAEFYKSYDYSSNRDGLFNVYNGRVQHIIHTPYAMKQIEIMQDALNKGLVSKEVFTMNSERAKEDILNGRYAMTCMTAFRSAEYFTKTGIKYVPLTRMKDWEGKDVTYQQKKIPYAAWGISSKAENPEEIVKFADFMASKEGKLLWMYGIEGKHYDLDENGQPVIKKELLDLAANDYAASKQLNLGALGGWWGRLLGLTDVAQYEDFGEYQYGEKHDPERVALLEANLAYGDYQMEYFDGAPAMSYLSTAPDGIANDLTQFIDAKYYAEVFIQACMSGSMAEATKIMDDYKELLDKQGLGKFEDYLQTIYKNDPTSIHFQ